jgi:hypothetical protein
MDPKTLVGKTLGFAVAFLETSHIPYHVVRTDDTVYSFDENTSNMIDRIYLEVDHDIITKVIQK